MIWLEKISHSLYCLIQSCLQCRLLSFSLDESSVMNVMDFSASRVFRLINYLFTRKFASFTRVKKPLIPRHSLKAHPSTLFVPTSSTFSTFSHLVVSSPFFSSSNRDDIKSLLEKPINWCHDVNSTSSSQEVEVSMIRERNGEVEEMWNMCKCGRVFLFLFPGHIKLATTL